MAEHGWGGVSDGTRTSGEGRSLLSPAPAILD